MSSEMPVFQQPSAETLPNHLNLPAGYLLALTLICVAVAANIFLLKPLGIDNAYLTLYPAVFASVLTGGIRPGLFSAALGTLAAGFFFMEPLHRMAVAGTADRLGLALFLMGSMATCGLACLSCRRHAAANNAILVRRGKEEEELRELTQRLNFHVDNSPLAVIEFSADRRLVRWSGEAERIFGWKAEEVLGKTREEFRWVHEDDLQQVEGVSAELRSVTTQRRFSANRNYRKDGSIVHCEWYNSCLMDESGRLRSILSLVLDVTKRKQVEEALQQYREILETRVAERTRELREKDRILMQQSRLAAMGEMINNIAHQWRQPLNILGLNIQRLSLFYGSGAFTQEFVKNSTADAMKLIRHMSQTIDDFRNFFKPDREKIDFNVNQAINQTVSLVEDSFKSHHIRIISHAEGDPVVHGYPNEFCQVLLNILQNARDALQERRVLNGRVIIRSWVENGRTQITIADNAGGVHEEIMERIFDPYYSTKGLQGTGIGLFMSKNIIEKNMGGSIMVNNVDEGAQFSIVI